jgi:hypothetical protein
MRGCATCEPLLDCTIFHSNLFPASLEKACPQKSHKPQFHIQMPLAAGTNLVPLRNARLWHFSHASG